MELTAHLPNLTEKTYNNKQWRAVGWFRDLTTIFWGSEIKHCHNFVWQGCFFFHYYLVTSTTNIEFKFSQVCYFVNNVEIHQERRMVFDNPKVSSVVYFIICSAFLLQFRTSHWLFLRNNKTSYRVLFHQIYCYGLRIGDLGQCIRLRGRCALDTTLPRYLRLEGNNATSWRIIITSCCLWSSDETTCS